ncbi:MAG: WD40 repeat domain-containing protein [Gemmatimonas sp.]
MISRRQFLHRSATTVSTLVTLCGCEAQTARNDKRFHCDFARIDEGGTAPIYALAWSPNGALLASSSSGDTRISMWEADTRRNLWRLKKPGMSLGTHSLEFSPDGRSLFLSSVLSREVSPRGALSLVDPTNGTVRHTIDIPPDKGIGQSHQAASWAVSADARYIVAAIWTPASKGGIGVYDGRTLNFEGVLDVQYYEGRRLVFDPITNALATQSVSYALGNPPAGPFPRDTTRKGAVEIWDLQRKEIIQYIPAYPSAIDALYTCPGRSCWSPPGTIK